MSDPETETNELFGDRGEKAILGDAQASRLRRDNELIDLANVAGTKSGRALLWRMLERGRAFQSPFVAGMPDVTAFQCGEQNVAQWLLAELMQAAPEAFALMQEEQRNVAV